MVEKSAADTISVTMNLYYSAQTQFTHLENVGGSSYFSSFPTDTLIKTHETFGQPQEICSNNQPSISNVIRIFSYFLIDWNVREKHAINESLLWACECNKMAKLLFPHQKFMCTNAFTQRDPLVSWISCFPIRLKTWMEQNHWMYHILFVHLMKLQCWICRNAKFPNRFSMQTAKPILKLQMWSSFIAKTNDE